MYANGNVGGVLSNYGGAFRNEHATLIQQSIQPDARFAPTRP